MSRAGTGIVDGQQGRNSAARGVEQGLKLLTASKERNNAARGVEQGMKLLTVSREGIVQQGESSRD